MHKVLLVNHDLEEATALQGHLEVDYDVNFVTDASKITNELLQVDIILLDCNINDCSGIDILMQIVGQSQAGILMTTPPEDSKCAMEAIRIGANNYLVKTPNYIDFAVHAIHELLDRMKNVDELKTTISVLKQRIAELEKQTGRSAANTSATDLVSEPATKQSEKSTREIIIAEITSLLKRDQINLPSYPDINLKMNALMQENASVEKIADLLKSDAVIFSKIMSAANSSYSRGISKIASIEDAIARLGLTQCKNHVEVISNRALYTLQNKRFRKWLEPLWSHNMACAHASYLLAEELELADPQKFFTHGLLHDIGKLLLLQILSELTSKKTFKTEISDDNIDKLITAHHGQFGYTLLKRWKFPDTYADVARYHDTLNAAENITKELLIVHLANTLAKAIGYGESVDSEILLEELDSSRLLKADKALIDKIKDKVHENMQEGTLGKL